MFSFRNDKAEFRSLFFERSPWLKRNCFDPVPYGWPVIDSALDFQDPTRELLKVIHGGYVDPSKYVEEYLDFGVRRRRIRKDRLYGMLAAGATIILNRVELVSPQIRDIVVEIGRFVGANTTANAYACLGGETASAVHWDTHDVFVVQISGRKRWRIYEPTHPLPVKSQPSSGREAEILAEPALDVVLEAGDALYLPRGWWHRVEPQQGYDTLHLAVAIHPPLILDYLAWACTSLLPDVPELRHALRGDGCDSQRLADMMSVVGERLKDPVSIQTFLDRMQQRDRVVTPFNIALLLDRADQPLPDTVVLRLNSRHLNPQSPKVEINGTNVPLEGVHQHVTMALSATTSTNLKELQRLLPEIDSGRLCQIIKELAKADIIQITLPG